MTPKPTRAHLSRLMKIWRSAGWPSRDPIDIDLLAAGWVSLVGDHPANECLRLTDAGVALLAHSRQTQRRSESDHDRLALRMADLLTASGRLVWRELSLRAQVDADLDDRASLNASMQADSPDAPTPLLASEPAPLWEADAADTAPNTTPTGPRKPYRWRLARPDLFSVRRTSNPAYLHPVVHEVKVSRADLLSDLRHAAKRSSYQWLASECHYVFPHGMAEPQELPEELGVDADELQVGLRLLQQLVDGLTREVGHGGQLGAARRTEGVRGSPHCQTARSFGLSAAVAINVVRSVNEATLGSNATVTAGGLILEARMTDVGGDASHAFGASATSGASGGSVGVAGSFALNVADSRGIAQIKNGATVTLNGTADVNLAAQNTSDATVIAKADSKVASR